jgi:integrase
MPPKASATLWHAFGKQLKAPAADLKRADVVRGLDAMAKDGKVAMASSTAAHRRACYQWAVKRGSISENPFADLPVAPVEKRDRVLSDEELSAVWKATDRPGPYNAIVRTLILTGQRREEVAGMTWAELDDDLSTWTLPASRAKNGVAHVVPLSVPVQALLCGVARQEGSDHVFTGFAVPSTGSARPRRNWTRRAGSRYWRLHDLRRTAATQLQRSACASKSPRPS